MKTCSGCKLTKPLIDYSKDSSRKDGLQRQCKLCHNQYIKNHYVENKAKYVETRKVGRKRRQQIINEMKSNTPCADCNKQHAYWIMQFDHLSDKDMKISKGFKQKGLDWTLGEIKKCEIVCANCHANRTYKRSIGKWFPSCSKALGLR